MEYIVSLMHENQDGFCGRFGVSQVSVIPKEASYFGKWIIAAIAIISLLGLTKNTKAQAPNNDKQTDEKVVTSSTQSLMGEVIIESKPVFPGGDKALHRFVTKNFKVSPNTPDGTLMINFLIAKNGTLSNFHILKSLTDASDQEAIRVFKSSPNWTFEIQGVYHSSISYVYPIKIKNGKVE